VSPMKSPVNGQPQDSRSLRDAVYQIDNDKDFKSYFISMSNKVPPKVAELKYERHPV